MFLLAEQARPTLIIIGLTKCFLITSLNYQRLTSTRSCTTINWNILNGSFKRAKDQIDIELKRYCIWKYIWFCILLKYYLSSFSYKLDAQYYISSMPYMIHLWECSIQENHIRCGWNGIFYLLDLLIVYSFSFSCMKTSANWS